MKPEKQTKEEIEEEIRMNETKLMSLGSVGMAYSQYWNELAKRNNELKIKLGEME